MADKHAPFRAQRLEQGGYVLDQPLDAIGWLAERAKAFAVAAKVGRDGSPAQGGKSGELPPPAQPTLGKAVQQQGDRIAGARAIGDKGKAVRVHRAGFDRHAVLARKTC